MTPIPEQLVDMTTPSPFKIKVRRPVQARSSQPTPVVTEVYTFPTRLRVQLANAQWKVALQVTERMKEPVPVACDAFAVSDLESDDSVIMKIPLSSRKRLASIVPLKKPSSYPSWTAKYRNRIEDRGVPIHTPFPDASEALLRSLEDAEKTRGGPKGILAKVTKIARDALHQHVSGEFEDDTDQESEAERQDGGEEVSQDLLECIRRMMIVEARIRESSKTKGKAGKNRKKMAPKIRTISKIPPGGLLGISSVPSKGVPARAGLRIEQYSNARYWQFAPDLESVRCDSRSRIC